MIERGKDCNAHIGCESFNNGTWGFTNFECLGKEYCPIQRILEGKHGYGLRIGMFGPWPQTPPIPIDDSKYNRMEVGRMASSLVRNSEFCQQGYTVIERELLDYDNPWQDTTKLIDRLPGLLSRFIKL